MKKGSVPVAGYILVFVFLILVGLFIYLGKPDCQFKDMVCFESYVTEHTIGLRLMNNHGYPVTITDVEVFLSNREVDCKYDPSKKQVSDLQIFDVILYDCTFPEEIIYQKNYQIDMKLMVKKTGFPKTNKGYIRTKIHPGLSVT